MENYGPQADYHDLYWALGDAGPQRDPNNHGQRTDILFGSIVRISVPSDGTGYSVPEDNYPNAGIFLWTHLKSKDTLACFVLYRQGTVLTSEHKGRPLSVEWVFRET